MRSAKKIARDIETAKESLFGLTVGCPERRRKESHAVTGFLIRDSELSESSSETNFGGAC